ncbi:MAG: hypothetical protein K2K26_12485 [Muribaculaceae bacterium]|nr:hypothetical protein [Muribaculaceae bacterium]
MKDTIHFIRLNEKRTNFAENFTFMSTAKRIVFLDYLRVIACFNRMLYHNVASLEASLQ